MYSLAKYTSALATLTFTITGALFLFSCHQETKLKDAETTTTGNKTETISTDTAKLSKLINLTIFKPERVKFKYTFYDNSGQNDRLSVPGPSDYFLEVELYFDPATFKTLCSSYDTVDGLTPYYDNGHFNFAWLDESTKQELLSDTDKHSHNHTGYFFGGGELWLLHNKLLLAKHTN